MYSRTRTLVRRAKYFTTAKDRVSYTIMLNLGQYDNTSTVLTVIVGHLDSTCTSLGVDSLSSSTHSAPKYQEEIQSSATVDNHYLPVFVQDIDLIVM